MFAQNTNSNNYNYSPQQFNQPAQNALSVKLDSLDSLMNGGGAKAFFNGDSQLGAQVSGEVMSVEVTQVNDFKTKQPAFWPDGNPKQQIHIVLQTSLPPEDEDDDGRRSLWVKGWGVQIKALRDACRRAGVKAPSKGDVMTARFTGFGQRGNNQQSPKLYEYEIRPAAQAQVDTVLAGQSQQDAQPAQPVSQPAQPAPVQAQSAPQPAQQAASLPVQQIQQLAQLGKTADQIAGFLGVSAQDVTSVLGGSNDEPEW